MGEFYEYLPPGPEEQHDRLVALRKLTSRNVPCIMWAEDALCYVYRVATALFDQQILVPDELLETAAAILQEGRYVPTVPAWDYAEIHPPNEGSSPFPKSIRLRHLDIPDHDPYKLWPLPGYILLLPMSYFAMDIRDKARFQSLVPPLDPSNSDILVPKYHTFLEGLVHFIMNPPTGMLDNPHPHVMGQSKHQIFIDYLTSWRVFYDVDAPLPLHELLPEEQKILDELQTEESRWYMHHLFFERRGVSFKDIKEYKLRQLKTTSVEPNSTAFRSGPGPSSTPGMSRNAPPGHSVGTPRSYSTSIDTAATTTRNLSPSRLPRLRGDDVRGATSAAKTVMGLSRFLRRPL